MDPQPVPRGFSRSGGPGDHSEPQSSRNFGDTGISTRIMVAAIVVLFVVVLFIVFLHIYARCFWSAARLRTRSRNWSRRLRRRASRLRYLAEISPQQDGQHQQQQLVDRGLDKSVLEALPVFFYTKASGDGKLQGEQVLDCPVCLAEFSEKEPCRRLPVCNHVFHAECIDMWFTSHSTCPLCRCSVGVDKTSTEVPTLEHSSSQQADPPSSTALAIQILQDEGPVLLNPQQQQQQQQLDTGAATTSTGHQVKPGSTDLEPRSFPWKQQQLVIAVPPRPGTSGSQVPSPSPSEGQRSPLSAHLRNIRRLLSRGSTTDEQIHSPALRC